MKKLLLSLSFIAFISVAFPLAACDPFNPGIRGVYYGGNVHLVTIAPYDNWSKVAHYQGTPSPSSWKFDTCSATTTISLPSNVKKLGGGVNAVSDDKIFFSFILWIGSSSSNAVPYLYCAIYDPVKGTFLPLKQVCALSDSASFVSSVLTVYGDKIVIITNGTTVTSSDGGQSWTVQQYPILTSSDNLAPVDAVTFYPMGDSSASIMLLCADATNQYGGGFYSAIWDGQWGDALTKVKVDTKGMIIGQLQLGTAKPPTGGNASKYHASLLNKDGVEYIQAFICPNTSMNPFASSGLARYEYNLMTQQWSMDSYTDNPDAVLGFFTFNSFADECSSADSTFCIQRQYIAVNCLNWSGEWHSWAFTSDAMVPQLKDPQANGYGWQGLPTATADGTQQENDKLRNYWSLVGVILGPPPFAVNDTTDTRELAELSNVNYGSETSSKVTQTQSTENTVMIAADSKVKAGVKDKGGASFNYEQGFKWSWETEHKSSALMVSGFHYAFGTSAEDHDISNAQNLGSHGWVVFNAPLMLTQYYKIFAYDYNVNTNQGTYTKQDTQTVSAVGMTVQNIGFDLADPGGSLDDIPGMCTGMRPFPHSQQVDDWHEMDWEDPDAPWQVLFGSSTSGGVIVEPLQQGTPGGVHFTTGTETSDSQGKTTGNQIEAGAKFSLGTDLNGFSESIVAGYDSQMSFNTETSTGGTSDIACDLEMSYTTLGDVGTVTSLQVQPYWLMATDYDAPWIPTGYSGQRPWCITWRVNKFTQIGFEQIGPGGTLPDDSSVDIGNGTVTELEGDEEAGREKWDSFSLGGGKLEWRGDNGATTPIPLTADTFEPASGAEVKIGGYVLKSDLALGRWTRHGQVWRYKTKDKSGPPVWTLELNFAKQSWSIDAKKLVLHDKIPAAKRQIRVELVLNQRYTIYWDILYRNRLQWKHEAPAQDADSLAITSYSGSYDSVSGDGEVELEGTLPSTIRNFGDTSFVFNGVSHDIPLLSLDDFAQAMDSGKDLVYKREGLVVRVDFAKKKWSASFKKDNVERTMAPKWGRSKLEIKVGGELRYSKVLQIDNFKSKLTFK